MGIPDDAYSSARAVLKAKQSYWVRPRVNDSYWFGPSAVPRVVAKGLVAGGDGPGCINVGMSKAAGENGQRANHNLA